jgi:integrase
MARIEKRGGEDVVPRTDDRGRTIDIRALRHTFGTHLSKAGVPLRTAQAAMRHSDPSLTANVYTDPKLLDMAAAVASLPDLPLGTVGVRAAAAN